MTEFELLVQTDPVEAFNQLADGTPGFDQWEKKFNEIEDFELEEVYAFGGDEGEGEKVIRVFAIRQNTKHRAYIKVTRYYSSYSGTEWDTRYTEVFPRQVTVTEYSENR